MWKIEVHKLISQIIVVFYQSGMWGNETESILKQIERKSKFLIIMVSFFMWVLAGACFTDDKNISMFLSMTAILVLILVIKCFYVLWKRKEIYAFLEDICVHSFVSLEGYTQAKTKLDNFIKFAYFFVSVIAVAAPAGIISALPIVSSERRLPLNLWLPLDWKLNEIVYWIAYAFYFVSILICCLSSFLSILIWYLMLNCSIKYESLGQQLRTLGVISATPLEKRNISKSKKRESFLQELLFLIKAHRTILKTVSGFKNYFEFFFFAQIGTSGICLCSIIYVLVFGNNDLFQSFVYIMIMLYCVFEITMVTYLGNEIKLSSDRLSYCVFESNWIDQPQSCKRYILIFGEFLKRPHELVIGKLYPLNLETFTSILRFAYSSFNILKNISMNQE